MPHFLCSSNYGHPGCLHIIASILINNNALYFKIRDYKCFCPPKINEMMKLLISLFYSFHDVNTSLH